VTKCLKLSKYLIKCIDKSQIYNIIEGRVINWLLMSGIEKGVEGDIVNEETLVG